MIRFPEIKNTIFSFDVAGFEVALRWYALMYIVGYVIGMKLAAKRVREGLFKVAQKDLENFLVFLILGMLVGARFFYVVFYNWDYYSQNLGDIHKIWLGGLSFHGAAAGMVTACALYARSRKIPFYMVTDALAYGAAPALFFGRVGNFINAELYGRASSVSWAMIFPSDPLQLPRHPSQLYQAITEGLVLFLAMHLYQRYRLKKKSLKIGEVGGVFLMGYGFMRFFVEYTRQPDEQLGLLWGGLSMGQYLCLVMFLIGVFVFVHVQKKMPRYEVST